MSATVLHLSDHRAVFLLPDRSGAVVFLASRGPVPRISLERTFDDLADADRYARRLSRKYGCVIVGGIADDRSGEDAA